MATFSDLIAEMEKTFKIQAAKGVTDNAVGLGLEDGAVVNIEQFPEGETVHAHCDMGGVPPDIRPAILMSLMAAHTCGIATQDCYFGFEPQRESLLLFRSMPMRGVPAEAMTGMIAHFLRQAGHWRQALPELFEEARRQAAGGGAASGAGMIKG